MRNRTFGRLGWQVSELGYGMWGLADWTGSDDAESMESLQLAVDSGVNFFDTAWAYGDGRSEQILQRLLKANSDKRLYVATKIPPRNRIWPSKRGFEIRDVFPGDYIREYVERSLDTLGVESIDLMQFHVWEDDWADEDAWQRVVDDIKREGLVTSFGISVNRWEPWNGMRTLRGGLIDAVQVIYNIFDQAPEDELFALCRELGVAVIARVPLDEGSLTGALTKDSMWPDHDWRSKYFTAENLLPTVERVEALKRDLPAGASLPEVALRFILSNPDVSTVIPGMRKLANVRANVASEAAGALPSEVRDRLASHRWDRVPTAWSF
ncbi:MAG TPA: aldo/keto reductase [Gemmatimonadaceae bacterium]|jgi:aryl-alcohol dehydrogenase-like predicted oxidoreductase